MELAVVVVLEVVDHHRLALKSFVLKAQEFSKLCSFLAWELDAKAEGAFGGCVVKADDHPSARNRTERCSVLEGLPSKQAAAPAVSLVCAWDMLVIIFSKQFCHVGVQLLGPPDVLFSHRIPYDSFQLGVSPESTTVTLSSSD